MATTGLVNGTIQHITIGGVKIDLQLSAEMKISMTPRESRTKDSGSFAERFSGIKDVEISGEAEIANDATYGIVQLFDAWLAGTKLTIAFKGNSGDAIYTVSGYVQELGGSAGVEENAKLSYTFAGDGGITIS